MAGLDPKDIFLVNRDTGTAPVQDWKSFKVSFSDLSEEIKQEISDLYFPGIGYGTVAECAADKDRFSSDPYSNGQDMAVIEKLFVNDALTEALLLKEKMQVVVLNRDTGDTAYYTLTADASDAGNGTIVIPVEFDAGSGTLSNGDLCNLRKIDISTGGGGGGSIEIGICPPGYNYDTINGSCVLDPSIEVTPGTLWYNPDDGITYIWYTNDLDYEAPGYDPSDGQWVDVRPGFGEGQDITFDDTPPVDPQPGDLWYNTNNGISYIWYVDVTTANGQWVDVRPPEGAIEVKPNAGIDIGADGLFIGDNWSGIPTLSSLP